MKTTFNHLINSRILTAFNSIEAELKLQKEQNYLFDLSYLGVLEVLGDKVIDFLQGQLTCDLHALSDIQMIQGAQCNLKGRVLALMDIINWQGIKLILPEDLLEQTQASLIKPAMLSRVSFKENKELRVFGFYLQNAKDIVPDSTFLPSPLYAQSFSMKYCCYHLGNGFYIFIVQPEFAEELTKRFSDKNQLLGSLTWHTLRLANQQFDIYPESRGLFLPHRLDLQQTQYLSFNKGCYKGQEIIARMHYKATLKHQLKTFVIKTDQTLHSGQKLFKSAAEIELGELIDFSILGQDSYLIAVSILKEAVQSVFFEGNTQSVPLFDSTMLQQ